MGGGANTPYRTLHPIPNQTLVQVSDLEWGEGSLSIGYLYDSNVCSLHAHCGGVLNYYCSTCTAKFNSTGTVRGLPVSST